MNTPPPASFVYNPPSEPYLSVLYHDSDIVVLDKPSGLLSVRGKAQEHADCLEKRVKERFPTAAVPHRLDMDTSGVMIMALTIEAQRSLSMQFEKRKTEKVYIARVWGHVLEDSGHVDLPLICDWPNRPKQMVDFQNGRSSQTDWEVLGRETQMTRMKLMPVTGRSHQLRVHMMALGHPILGDDFYAHEAAFRAAPRLQLHAQELTIAHPLTGETMKFQADCPF